MSSLVIFIVCLALTGASCWAAIRSRWAFRVPAAVRSAADGYYQRIARALPLGGPVAATGAVVGSVVVGGVGATILLLWGLGRAIVPAHGAVDLPVYRYFADGHHRLHWWTNVNLLVTQIGNTRPTETIAVLGALGFAALRASRRWVPFVTFPVAYLTEKYPQHWLALLVHRGHPPTAVGTWPSGGCARALLIYGLVAYFLAHWLRDTTRTTRIAVWTAVMTIEVTEAYSRVYLLKHWFTDVLPGGILFGAMLLTVWTTAAWLMDRPRDTDGIPQPAVRGSGASSADPSNVLSHRRRCRDDDGPGVRRGRPTPRR